MGTVPIFLIESSVMKIISVVGARPNFMKIAPVMEAMKARPGHFDHILVHTGQHYDEKMSAAFFDDLGLPRPDLDLGVGSGSHAEQTGKVMMAFEKVCLREKPDLVIVVGDINSTMACAVTAKKLWIRVAHVEAGLRSRDMRMPEEINRICTDAVSDYLYTTEPGAGVNLEAEGVFGETVFVGNTMVDSLLKHREKAEALGLRRKWGLEQGGYATLTLHRPSNVDDGKVLRRIFEALREISGEIPIVFAVHPRTLKMIERFDLTTFVSRGGKVRGIWGVEPLGYLEFLHLNLGARLVLTDSGGLQEETTVLGVPCITLRENTERPVTCAMGTNELAGSDPEKIVDAARRALRGEFPKGRIPEKWDGRAGERIVDHLLARLSQ
jgi:UDP-N-acetylglucosamine 2-epimerase (non-hydrolysing)